MPGKPIGSTPDATKDMIRRTYMAFKSGAALRSHDVKRLLEARGVVLSSNRLRELGRDSDRGHPITHDELYTLVSAWADEQHDQRISPPEPQEPPQCI